MPPLIDFLKRNSVKEDSALPLVHTSRAFHIRSFLNTNKIVTTRCDVFNEKLNYFFMGRPAYKYTLEAAAEFWEFPVCFIVRYESVKGVRRIFPFDSGGFANKFMPAYLQMMELGAFEVGAYQNAPAKLVGAFFGNKRNYFNFKGSNEHDFMQAHNLSPLDAEILALHKLSCLRPTRSMTGIRD